MELSNQYIYKIYIVDTEIDNMDNLDIILNEDIGGVYILCTYINDFIFDNKDGHIFRNNNGKQIFLGNDIVIKCIPIEII